jgi:hypothetical protein
MLNSSQVNTAGNRFLCAPPAIQSGLMAVNYRRGFNFWIVVESNTQLNQNDWIYCRAVDGLCALTLTTILGILDHESLTGVTASRLLDHRNHGFVNGLSLRNYSFNAQSQNRRHGRGPS